jgi:hypothetical protein
VNRRAFISMTTAAAGLGARSVLIAGLKKRIAPKGWPAMVPGKMAWDAGRNNEINFVMTMNDRGESQLAKMNLAGTRVSPPG